MSFRFSYLRQWNEIIFENRNKDYGAYWLRAAYLKNIAIAFILTLGALGILINILEITGRASIDSKPLDLTNIVYTDLAPPPSIKINPEVKFTRTPSAKTAIKQVQPVVVHEEVPEEKPVEQVVEGTTDDNTSTDSGVFSEYMETDGEGVSVYESAEVMPEFPGGEEALKQFISSNIRYPLSAQQKHITGTVFVSFVVGSDGSISDVRTIKGIFSDCDIEAERVVSIMPHWKPGRQSGKPVRVRFALPIRFRFGA